MYYSNFLQLNVSNLINSLEIYKLQYQKIKNYFYEIHFIKQHNYYYSKKINAESIFAQNKTNIELNNNYNKININIKFLLEEYEGDSNIDYDIQYWRNITY